MKKKESKYGLLKAVLVMLVLAFVLSWIIPSGAYSSSGFSELGVLRLGIHDIATSIYYGISIGLDKIVLLLVIGVFYAVLTRTQAYERIVSGIARKLNKKSGSCHVFSYFGSAYKCTYTDICCFNLCSIYYFYFKSYET